MHDPDYENGEPKYYLVDTVKDNKELIWYSNYESIQTGKKVIV